MAAATADLSQLVREQIAEILGDPSQRAALGIGSRFTLEHEDRLDWTESTLRRLQQDKSFGRALDGPLWLSGTSVVDGTITADKLIVNSLESVTVNTGDLNATGTLTAAASFPATGARIELNSVGLWGYSGAVTTTFKLNTDGSGEIGTGSNKISWDTSGVLTVPVATISSLTIAEVGSGTLGGTYQSSSSSTRFEMSSTSFRALASGTETFKIDATTGAVTATGSFTVQSAASGARVVVSNAGGLEGYNSGGTRTFFVNAATGAGQLGTGSNNIAWDSSGNASIGGVTLSSGKITASHLTVSNLAAISADLGTITAGTINGGTINATTITTGTLSAARISGGSVGGSFNLGSANITVNSTGVITNSDGDSWGPNGITLVSSGTFGDSIKWRVSGVDKGSIWAASTVMAMTYVQTSDAQLELGDAGGGARYGKLGAGSPSTSFLVSSTGFATVDVGGNANVLWDGTSRRTLLYGALHPGTGSGSQTTGHLIWSGSRGQWINSDFQFSGRIFPGNGSVQANTSIDADSSDLGIWLGGNTDAAEFFVRSNAGTSRFMVSAGGKIGISTGSRDDGATSVATVTSAWAIYDVGGSLVGYIPIYASYS